MSGTKFQCITLLVTIISWLYEAILYRPSDLTLRIRLIIETPQDPRHYRPKNWKDLVIYLGVSTLLIVRLAVPILIEGVPTAAQADFSPDSSNSLISDTNSQNMPLLEAPINSFSGDSTSSASTGASDSILSLVNTAIQNPPATESTSSSVNSSPVAPPTTGSGTQNPAPTVVAPSSSPAVSTSTSTNVGITTYKVQSGDTLSGIASQFNITLNTLLQANQLKKTSTLKVGEKLTILPVSGIYYKVQKGDSLGKIASTYDSTSDQIESVNGLTSSSIHIGQYLIIPTTSTVAIASANQVSAAAAKTPTVAVKTSSSLISKVTNAALGVKVAEADTSSVKESVLAYYIRPITGGVLSQGIHLRNAVDLATSCGKPIYASAAGTVTVVENNDEWNGGYGNYVEIDHNNGSQTLYAHMTAAGVYDGETVTQGQTIGTIGETGDATGCHVHFEIHNEPGGLPNPFDVSAFESA